MGGSDLRGENWLGMRGKDSLGCGGRVRLWMWRTLPRRSVESGREGEGRGEMGDRRGLRTKPPEHQRQAGHRSLRGGRLGTLKIRREARVCDHSEARRKPPRKKVQGLQMRRSGKVKAPKLPSQRVSATSTLVTSVERWRQTRDFREGSWQGSSEEVGTLRTANPSKKETQSGRRRTYTMSLCHVCF